MTFYAQGRISNVRHYSCAKKMSKISETRISNKKMIAEGKWATDEICLVISALTAFRYFPPAKQRPVFSTILKIKRMIRATCRTLSYREKP